jgi:hemerythrin
MGWIDWDESFCVGVDRIDAQHRVFLDYVNELHRQVASGEDAGVVGLTLNRLSDYANFHFAEEEAAMWSAAYRGLDAHRMQHDEFRLQLSRLKSQYSNQDPAVIQGLVEFTGDWLRRHILEVDRRFGGHVRGEGTAA